MMMSSTGTAFYTKVGDRLPTRDVKSRRGGKQGAGRVITRQRAPDESQHNREPPKVEAQ